MQENPSQVKLPNPGNIDNETYLTDSDIDDPKYTPLNQNNLPPSNISFLPSNYISAIQEKIQQEKDLLAKILKNSENEKQILSLEIASLHEKLKVKDSLITEFQTIVDSSKDKFSQIESELLSYKKENISLNEKLSQYDKKFKSQKELIKQNEEIKNTLLLYKKQLKELENSYIEKEKKNIVKSKERELELQNEHTSAITKLKNDKDLIVQENDKLKSDILSLKTKINTLIKESEDKQFDLNLTISKYQKENKKLNEQINEKNSELNDFEKQYDAYKQKALASIESLQSKNKELNNKLTERNKFLKKQQLKLEELTRNIETLSQEGNQLKINYDNKEKIIQQLKTQNKQFEKELKSKESELINLDQTILSNYQNYCEYVNQIIAEKEQIMKENEEVKSNLEIINEQYKKLQDTFHIKIQSLNSAYLHESSKNKNKENQYKEMIKQMKLKERKIIKENNNLKEMLMNKEIERKKLENDLYMQGNNSYFNNKLDVSYTAGYLNNSTFDKILLNRTGLSRNNTMNININNTNTFVETERDEEQKKSLDEFKRLLSKMDERLDTSKAKIKKEINFDDE